MDTGQPPFDPSLGGTSSSTVIPPLSSSTDSSSSSSSSSSSATTASTSASVRPSSANPNFDPERCGNYFRECAKHLHDMPIEPFLAGCNEIKKIIGTLGTALGIASVDITEKVGVINDRLKEIREVEKTQGLAPPLLTTETMNPDDKRVHETLQWMIQDEINRGVVARNDWSFISGSRSLLRLMWFLDFVYILLNKLLQQPDVTLKDCANEAYEVSLSPHHPWLLRTTIHAALMMLPSKETFLKNLAGPRGGEDSDNFPQRMNTFVSTIEPVRQELWKIYKEKNLENLP